MKNTLFILLLLTLTTQLLGQTKTSNSFLTNSRGKLPACIVAYKSDRNLSLKSYLIARHEYRQVSKAKYAPKLSIDLLDGKGVHLFSITNLGPIPNMNIGARITAGIKISI